jgi:hypothetical protein
MPWDAAWKRSHGSWWTVFMDTRAFCSVEFDACPQRSIYRCGAWSIASQHTLIHTHTVRVGKTERARTAVVVSLARARVLRSSPGPHRRQRAITGRSHLLVVLRTAANQHDGIGSPRMLFPFDMCFCEAAAHTRCVPKATWLPVSSRFSDVTGDTNPLHEERVRKERCTHARSSTDARCHMNPTVDAHSRQRKRADPGSLLGMFHLEKHSCSREPKSARAGYFGSSSES